MQFSHNDCEVLEKHSVYKGVFSLSRWLIRHRLFNGEWSEPLVRELFERAQAVSVLLYDPERDAVVLIKQFRVGALCNDVDQSPWLVELVAGGAEQGESAIDVAERESVEEAGYTFQEWEPVCNYFTSPGGSNEYMQLVCGRVSIAYESSVFGLAEEGEDILAFAVSREEAWNLLQQGELCNAPIIIALQWLQFNYQRLQTLWLK